MEIDLRQVREVTLRLLDHLIETHGISTVDIDKDFYWEVPSDLRFEPENTPTDLHVGSLVDEWGFVSDLLQPDNDPIAYQLAYLAPILAYIGEKLAAELSAKGG